MKINLKTKQFHFFRKLTEGQLFCFELCLCEVSSSTQSSYPSGFGSDFHSTRVVFTRGFYAFTLSSWRVTISLLLHFERSLSYSLFNVTFFEYHIDLFTRSRFNPFIIRLNITSLICARSLHLEFQKSFIGVCSGWSLLSFWSVVDDIEVF